MTTRLRSSWISAVGLGLLATAVAGGCQTSPAGVVLKFEVPDADRDADVYVDGNYLGQVGALSGGTTGEVRLAPGVHRVEVRKPGRFPVQKTVRVKRRSPPQHVIQAELLEDPQ